jgi:aminopeptidase YwaD
MNPEVKRVFQRNRSAALACCLILLTRLYASALEIPAAPSPIPDSLRTHARYLSSNELTGRGVDTPGIKLARDYIAREFARYGLLPGGNNGGYLQSFDVVTGVRVTEPALLRVSGAALALHEDWLPLGFSASGKADGGLVFIGYGITAKDYGYDDYEGVDVKDKVVIVLRYEPPPKDDKSPFRKAPQYSNHATLRAKANNAREHGAAAMILVDLHHDGAEQRELIPLRRSLSRGGNSLVAAQAKRRVVAQWLETHGVSLAALKAKIDYAGRPASMALPGAQAALTVTLEEIRAQADNVVGIIPGSDPHLKNEHIVIGAHYDHLGFGHYGTRDSSTEGEIHHGADDNASGTAVLLHMAEQLAGAEPKPARTTVFAAFSGEELGLFGSRRYVNDPPLALSSTKAMINLDMVGRLRDNRVTVFGARSAQVLSGIVAEEARKMGLEIRESDGIGRSDNISFYNKKIPALHIFTGSHADYHRPSDTWDKLNYDGMYRVSNLALGTIWRIANGADPLQFVASPSRPPGNETGQAPAIRAYLGSIPDYDGSDDGVKLSGVSPGSPAARAGLREGDVIVEFAGAKIQNIEDLMGQLSAKKPGDEVEIVVLRAGLPQTVKATLAARG